MSGSSKEFSASDLDAERLKQERNREVARRIMAQGRAAKPVDPETLAAHRESLNAKVSAPPKVAVVSPFAVKSAAQLRREEEERIALLTRALPPRPITGPNAIVTDREKGEKRKAPKPAKAPKADKVQAAKQPTTPEIPAAPARPLTEAEREARIAAYCDAIRAGKVVEQEKKEELISYTYDLPGAGITTSGKCKPSEFPPIAVKLAQDGSRRVRPAVGVVLTLVHKREVTDPVTGKVTEAEFSVGRKYFDTEIKAHEHGAKVLAEGLPRRKQCPECKGMGRVIDYRNTSKVCGSCETACNPNTCTADASCKCRGEGSYGRGTVDAEPLKVHAYHVSRDVERDGSRGVLALDRPLPAEKPKPKGGSVGGKGNHSKWATWQKNATTTKVTFSHG